MNEVLQLKGKFKQKSNNSKPGSPNLPVGTEVKVEHLEKLQKELEKIEIFWNKEKLFKGILLSIIYNNIVAKSNRVSGFLSKGSFTANSSIVGAKFSDGEKKRHIITHYISKEIFKNTIIKLKNTIEILKLEYKGIITSEEVKNINDTKQSFEKYNIARTSFLQMVVDSHYIDRISIPENEGKYDETSIISIYKTDGNTSNDTIELMKKIGIDIFSANLIDETTMLLKPDEIILLKEKAPYLISMATEDISKLTKEDFAKEENDSIITIPSPNNEPIIGVIDTMFYERSLFF